MKKLFLLIGLVFGSMLFSMPIKAQYYCPNLDFAMRDFTNWQAYTGSCLNSIDTIYPCQPISSKHTIVLQYLSDEPQQDEYCDTILKSFWPQIMRVAKLGNDTANAKINALEYTLDIDSNNSLLTLYFAFVLENSQEHNPEERPRFTIQVQDSLGNSLTNLAYANLEFVADTGLQNVACMGEIVARNWTTVGFNLEEYIGQTIKLYFEVRDGSQGNHFGYAYIAAECRPARMEKLQYCPGLSDVRLRAPYGFAHYKWTKSSDSTWEMNYQNSPGFVGVANGEVFTCQMTSGLDTNCTVTFSIGFIHTLYNTDITYWYDTCNRTATFADLSTVINSEKEGILWEVMYPNSPYWWMWKTVATSQDSLFTYTFPNPDDDNPVEYLIRLNVYSEDGCSNMQFGNGYPITVYPSPIVKIDGVNQICSIGDSVYLKAVPVRYTFINHTWTWEDTNGLTQTAIGDSIEIYTPGAYMLASEANSGCIARDTFIVTPSKLNIDMTITDINCFGESTGALQYGQISGGTNDFQWVKWMFGDTTVDGSVTGATYTNLAAGIYSVEVLDSRNCSFSDEFEIKQNDSLKISITAFSTTNDLNNGALKVNTIGGVPPYKYEIKKEDNTFISSSDTAWGLDAGIYHIEVTDAVNCVTSDTISVGLILGISDIRNNNSILIYPNPVFDGKLMIEDTKSILKDGEQIIITDMTGKIVFVSMFSSIKKELDVSLLASGIYVVQIGNIREKFTKQ